MRPNHLAIVCRGSAAWALHKNKKPYEGYRKAFDKILEIIELQVKKNIPITTFYIMPHVIEVSDDYSLLVDEITAFLSELQNHDKIHKHRVKVSVLGKWYTLPGRSIEAIKNVIDKTKEYDNFFVNLCINYDGQEEIVDACKMVARRVKLGKIDVDAVTKETIKDDLYSSYFLPPDFIFVTGKKRSVSGFLLWDSVNSEIVFTNKLFPEFTIKDIEKGMKRQ